MQSLGLDYLSALPTADMFIIVAIQFGDTEIIEMNADELRHSQISCH